MKLKEIISSVKSSVKFWIIFLVILLVVFNTIAFSIYHISHPSENFCTQLWMYFESDAFKIITASVILPILLFLLESLFKIGAKRKEEHEKRQWECVEKTSKMWDQLFSLANEVRYFEMGASKEARIEDIIKKLNNFTGLTGYIVNMWWYMFFRYFSEKDIGYSFSWNNIHKKEDSKRFLKNLNDYHKIDWVENAEIRKSDNGKIIRIFKDENSAEIMIDEKEEKASLKISDGRAYDLKVKEENGKYYIGFLKEDIENLFLFPLNVFLYSTFAVAYYIQCNNNRKEVRDLQYSLELIQEEIKKMTYHTTIDILKSFMDLEEGGKKATVAKNEIYVRLNKLKIFADRLKYTQKEYIRLFPIKSNKVNDFKNNLEMIKKTCAINGRAISARKKFLLNGPFRDIPLNERMRLIDYPFSKDYVNCLAFYLIFEDLNERIESMTA